MRILTVINSEANAAELASWGTRLARGHDAESFLLKIDEGGGVGDAQWRVWPEGDNSPFWHQIHEVIGANGQGVAISSADIISANLYRSVINAVQEVKPSLLIVSDSLDTPAHQRSAIAKLLEDVACAVMVIRIGEGGNPSGEVLLPCAGGPNSRRALQLVAQSFQNEVTALFIEPNADDLSQEVGEERLNRHIEKAGLSGNILKRKVLVDDDPLSAIRQEIQLGDYGLLIIGASGVSTLRRKLFGTVPEKLMRGTKGVSVAVFRAEHPRGHRIRDAFERFLLLKVPQLKRDERVSLFAEIEEKSRWSFDFAVLMILATAIASLGLLADSGAVVIGAMLVAPLMTPLLGGGLALVQGNLLLWKRSQKAVGLGFLSALIVGLLMGIAARMLNLPLTAELAARGAPTILDLGVAFVSGVAASYCLARPKLSGALAGVAIAAALVPPIATTGICLAIGEIEVAQKAALLFGTNVVAIVIGSACNFFLAGVRGKSSNTSAWSQRCLIGFTLIMLGLLVPLSSILLGKISTPISIRQALNEVAEVNKVKVIEVSRKQLNDGKRKIVVVVASSQPINQELANAFSRSIKDRTGKDVNVSVVTQLRVESAF